MADLSSPQHSETPNALAVAKPQPHTFQDQKNPSRSAWISERSRLIFSGYRRDEFADPEGFSAQLGLILERYSDEIVSAVSSPFTGIQRRYKTPPSIAAIVEACDEEVARLERIRRFSEMRAAPREPRPVDPTARANLLVHRDAPGYDAMVKWAKTAGPEWYRSDPKGIWVPLGVYQEHRHSGGGAAEFRQFTESELRAIYRMSEA